MDDNTNEFLERELRELKEKESILNKQIDKMQGDLDYKMLDLEDIEIKIRYCNQLIEKNKVMLIDAPKKEVELTKFNKALKSMLNTPPLGTPK